jgi:DNA-binding transcriptional ArsR family regulator
MPQTRIQGKFYPLQHEEFIKLNKRLTQSELAVYLWLKTNDPFGDKLVEASTKQIADDLNVSRRTIQRALVKLRDENLIDLIITKFQYRVKSCPAEDTSEQKVKETLRVATSGSPSDTSVAIGTRMSPSVRECRHRYENVAIGTGMSPPTAETQSEQKLENPKTLKTYKDFKDSLSESEGEKFFNFVEEKTNNLERPINDLEAWLASKNAAKQNRWEIYYRSFQEEQINEDRKTTRHSENGGSSSLGEKNSAIAKFRQKMRIDELVDEPEDVDMEEVQRQQAEINKLLDNPPELGERKSFAQQRRDQIAEAKRQQEEWKRANKEAAEERAEQQNLDIDGYQDRIQRQIEEFNRLHNIGNHAEIEEVDEKDLNKEAEDERAEQQNFDIDEYQAEIERQIEEFNRLHNIGNHAEIEEIDEEDLEDE